MAPSLNMVYIHSETSLKKTDFFFSLRGIVIEDNFWVVFTSPLSAGTPSGLAPSRLWACCHGLCVNIYTTPAVSIDTVSLMSSNPTGSYSLSSFPSGFPEPWEDGFVGDTPFKVSHSALCWVVGLCFSSHFHKKKPFCCLNETQFDVFIRMPLGVIVLLCSFSIAIGFGFPLFSLRFLTTQPGSGISFMSWSGP